MRAAPSADIAETRSACTERFHGHRPTRAMLSSSMATITMRESASAPGEQGVGEAQLRAVEDIGGQARPGDRGHGQGDAEDHQRLEEAAVTCGLHTVIVAEGHVGRTTHAESHRACRPIAGIQVSMATSPMAEPPVGGRSSSKRRALRAGVRAGGVDLETDGAFGHALAPTPIRGRKCRPRIGSHVT